MGRENDDDSEARDLGFEILDSDVLRVVVLGLDVFLAVDADATAEGRGGLNGFGGIVN